MTQFTIDVQIMMSASTLGDLDHHEISRSFLESFADADDAVFAVDSGGLIAAQYESKVVDPVAFAKVWLTRMQTEGRMVVVARTKVNKPVRLKLLECGFQGEDFDY